LRKACVYLQFSRIFCCSSICRNQLAICNFPVLFVESSLLFAAYSVLFADSTVLFVNLLSVPFPFSMQFFFLRNPVCYLQLIRSICRISGLFANLLCVPFPFSMQFFFLQNPVCYCSSLRSICRIHGFICKSTKRAVSCSYAVCLFAESS
jgi:hypothetical protein